MIEESETFGGSWSYKAQYFSGNGFRHHFVDEGNSDPGETFVLLHGEPTWGYISRAFIPRLSELDVRDVTLVMQDWGGPIGTNFALRHPDRIKRIFYIDSFPRVGIPAGIDMTVLAQQGATPWAEFFTSEAFDPVMSHLGRSILSILKLVGFVNHDVINDEWIRAYASPFPTPESCKGAKAFPLNTMNPVSFAYFEAAMKTPGAVEALATKPAMSVMGEEDRTLPPLLAEGMLREVWPDAPFVKLPGVGHFAQEDAPGTLVAMIEQFVRSR